MPSERKHARIEDEIRRHAAVYMARESNQSSLITVTRVELAPNKRSATAYVSILPHDAEQRALNFAKRHERDFRVYLAKHARMQYTPDVRFALDLGERNRQRIDELSRE